MAALGYGFNPSFVNGFFGSRQREVKCATFKSGTRMVLYDMPPKIRELMRELTKAGFENRGGKGSHRNFRHPKGVNITISGRAGNDAKHYQIRDVKRAIELVTNEKE
jgi:predicted RNA binding protein YcfA (HicA-like mRNA interferase family)